MDLASCTLLLAEHLRFSSKENVLSFGTMPVITWVLASFVSCDACGSIVIPSFSGPYARELRRKSLDLR